MRLEGRDYTNTTTKSVQSESSGTAGLGSQVPLMLPLDGLMSCDAYILHDLYMFKLVYTVNFFHVNMMDDYNVYI